MKTFFLVFFSFFVCSYTFSQVEISEVTVNYEGDGIYKFSATYKGYSTNKLANIIEKRIAEFELKNKVKHNLIDTNETFLKSDGYLPVNRLDILLNFFTIKNNMLFVSDEELAVFNAEIIKTLKQYKKLKEDNVFDDTKYLELIEKLIDSLVVL